MVAVAGFHQTGLWQLLTVSVAFAAAIRLVATPRLHVERLTPMPITLTVLTKPYTPSITGLKCFRPMRGTDGELRARRSSFSRNPGSISKAMTTHVRMRTS